MTDLSKPEAESCALVLATQAATWQRLDPEAPIWAIGTRGHGSGEPHLVPGTATAYKPIIFFSSCSVRVTLVFKYFKSRGQRRGTAKKGKRLRPAALSNVDAGTLSHKTPDGSKPEAKTYAQPPWQLFICSIDAGGFLFLPTESSAPSPKGALTGNWTQKRMHQKPNGSCLCSGKREIWESGDLPTLLSNSDTPSPFCAPAFHKRHPSGSIPPPQCTARDVATREWKNRDDLWSQFCLFPLNPWLLFTSFQLRQRKHLISKQAVVARSLRVYQTSLITSSVSLTTPRASRG